MKRPLGLEKTDTLEDCFKRADRLSRGNSYSAMMCGNKDLRRIVLLVHEVRELKKELDRIYSAEVTEGVYDTRQIW